MKANPTTACRRTGLAMVGLGIYLNVPFGILSATFSYPQILRQPAGEILTRFAAGGPGLILVWYAFVLAALALIPRWQYRLAGFSALLIVGGLAEGFVTVIPFDPGFLADLTPIGFLLLSGWMVASGFTLLRAPVQRPLRENSPASIPSIV